MIHANSVGGASVNELLIFNLSLILAETFFSLVMFHAADTVKLHRKGDLEPLLSKASAKKTES